MFELEQRFLRLAAIVLFAGFWFLIGAGAATIFIKVVLG